MLTPPHCCIQVALSINRATCSFDTSHSRYPARRAWGSAVYFWGIASTNGNLGNGLTVTTAARFCQLAKYRAIAQTTRTPILS
jgi:hypothetical protein